jgi:hypothetical protein
MTVTNETHRMSGLSLRRAAVVAGISYFLMPVAFADFYIFPKLIISGDIAHTVQNISLHRELFFVGILCHFITLVLDVILAWALYVLLAPVNQALSLLAAFFRLIYAANYLAALNKLLTVLPVLNAPYFRTLFGDQQLDAQVQLLIRSFHSSLGLVVFGIYLILLGYLVFRSGYIPWILGVVLAVVGACWILNSLRPYFFPHAPLGFLPLMGFGELLLPLWLLIRGWKIRDPRIDAA